ncbi:MULTISPECIES: Tfp pilus assembly protein FimT/FimU [Vibrio]|uniref:pilus assembly FimT family protein n=1 Tax=Vibrio TaxID=662 RepID=UPI001BD34A37|nr:MULTISPECIES: MSHA biogenesis protein MshA [Vibrio]MDK9794519.1 MSHA biogenesis protein MshA [Vibrio sp. D431a]MBS9912046.1 MSHA biogenesis protein MshA [Vibrio alginolyticus]MBT0049926.1 MSHA biogenesis protein MshA [Vibrio alginolyticus]MBT0063707.1 MSHA biogenesis protein MshA [Vibrio alginolyticus]MCG6354651.1 MSHA biogenesis protein MshA [Vibrio alginolyticus]
MRIVKGLSRIELVVILVLIAITGYIVLPSYVSFEPETYEAKWEQTKQTAEHVSETLSNKETYDRIEEEISRSKGQSN